MFERLKGWFNAFAVANAMRYSGPSQRSSMTVRPYSGGFSNENSIINSIYTRIAIDVAAIDIRHVQVDELGRYVSDMKSDLNYCFMLAANLDQSPRAFKQDIVATLFDDGAVAIVPVDYYVDDEDPNQSDIQTLRVGRIRQWHPRHVTASVYNVDVGDRQDIVLPKEMTAIVQNPLYSVMNEPNSTLRRLVRKLALLDGIDEVTGSGKLDLIIQLPYVVKSEARKNQAEERRKDIEFQLKGSQYGVAYTDGTEKITQLNRPTENNLLKQIEYLMQVLYGQLGITEEVMNGTATEAAMLNYYNRTIEPVVTSIVEAMRMAFIRRSGLEAGEEIQFFQNPFRLVPAKDLAEIADKFTRNEILTSNEMRGFIGFRPSKDPKADQLTNPNMPTEKSTPPSNEQEVQNER